MKIKPFIPILIILSLFILVWAFNLHHYLSFAFFKIHQATLENYIKQHFYFSLILYSLSYILVVTLSLPVATLMTLIGGFLFGQWLGTSLVVFSATLGACLLFLSARMASSELINKRLGGFATKMQAGFQENALSYLLTLRLIPLFPFVVVNLAAAFFQISLRTFALGTFFGIIPGSFVYVSIGVSLEKVIQKTYFSPHIVLEPKIFLSFIGLGILALLPVIYKYLKKSKSS